MAQKNLLFALLILPLLLWGQTQAACSFASSTTYRNTVENFTIPLDSRTFSVPQGVPVGQVIARQWVNVTAGGSKSWRVECDSTGINRYYQYGSRPKPLATGYTNVYQTSIKGIGIRFSPTTSVAPNPYPTEYSISPGSYFPHAPTMGFSFYIEFIKTDETVVPGEILAIDLPVTEHALGQSGSNVVFARFTLSGQFHITAPTCDIAPASASMTVQLGSHPSGSFNGVGSGTNWKNASIRLINCPQFYGNKYTRSYTSYYANGTNARFDQYALNANGWSLTLSPRNGTVDASNGIMKIDDETGKASGVGIQLSRTENVSGKIDLDNAINKSIATDGSVTAITIPLYARYIQTESTITGGKANGRLEYTITYK
ncbi:TPA: type 1 fimbrial protein [Kluyvera intermedia]|nr:type 1 fimbrial protein [Kluyvera intermedia]